MNIKILIKEIRKMGAEAVRFYNEIKDDPLIKFYEILEYGFIAVSHENRIRYIYIKPSERNKGICSDLVKKYKMDSPTPEIIHLMDKNGILTDIKNGFKAIKYSENELYIFDVELGYQIRASSIGNFVEYNKWNGKHFEVINQLYQNCSLQEIREKMKANIKRLKDEGILRMEFDQYGLYNH